SHALKYGDAIAAGQLLAPAKTLGEMSRIVFNDYVDASLAALFVLVVVSTVVYGLINIWRALGNPQPTAMETGFAGAAAGGSHA
ncbi:MAG TPA: carbon starvation protein A, partial [Xanthobacteraceae bacterium]|nr:carbon starvation protein A [Xanthobacteraceae bacterium]